MNHENEEDKFVETFEDEMILTEDFFQKNDYTSETCKSSCFI